jgi:hypothetical protein
MLFLLHGGVYPENLYVYTRLRLTAKFTQVPKLFPHLQEGG